MPAKKQPKVSILVPCYNVEKYLPECLDSIIDQTLKDIEIICINDGSTDSTLKIIKQYAKKDKRIVVIDKENEGYGKSMNRGIDAATGEYIGIVESDDWIDSDMFESLVKIADKNELDVIKSNFYEYTTEKGSVFRQSFLLGDKNKVIKPINNKNVFFIQPSIWSAIYKRDFIEKNKIRFLESPGASYQDTGFAFKVWSMAKRAFLTDKAYLHYRCDNTNSSVKSNGKIFCVCDEYDEIERFLIKNKMLNDDMKKLIINMKFNSYMWNINRLTGEAQKQFFTRFVPEFREYIKNKSITKRNMDNKTWLKLLRILYPKNIAYKIRYTLCNILSPIYKTRIDDGYKKYYLFDKIVVKKIKLYK